MVSALEAAGLLVLLGANTLLAAVLTRVFRVRLTTRWGSVLYVLFVVPVALLVVTLVFGIVLGPDLGDPTTVVGLTILLPMTLGIAIDYFWMPAPEDVELPETA